MRKTSKVFCEDCAKYQAEAERWKSLAGELLKASEFAMRALAHQASQVEAGVLLGEVIAKAREAGL